MTRRIHLNAFAMNCAGHQSAGLWRHPDDAGTRYTDLEHWTRLARTLEDAGFDALFLADVLGVYDVYGGSRDAAVRAGAQVPLGDPMPLVGAMAAVTSRLGFGLTVSTSYEHPYALARRFTTLDHLTKGRVAWNVVTGYLASAAANLGLGEQTSHDRRYDMAEEYMEVCYKLWEASWEDDAVVLDAERGVYTDPTKVHDVGHHGEFFDVPGPFLCEPSPQRTPVIFQAGASPRGKAFAGRHAEAVFVSGPSTTVVARTVAGIRAAAAEAGRDPESVTVFVQLAPVVAPTSEEARARHESYLAAASHEGAMALFGGWTGLDLADVPPDEPLRHVETDAGRSALASFTVDDPDREWTVREVAAHLAIGGRGPVAVGSPTEVADEMERWIDETGADGFNLAYAVTPGTFEQVAELVVPELRRRGRMPATPPSGTLREVLGGAGPRVVPAFALRARERSGGPEASRALTSAARTLRTGGYADLIADIAAGAAERARDDVNPHGPMDRIRAERLGAVTLPAEGPAGSDDDAPLTMRELLGLVVDLAEADPDVAHALRAHFWQVREMRRLPAGPARDALLEQVRAGRLVGNASSEAGGAAGASDYTTTLRRTGPGGWRLDGRKAYSTGTLFADLVAVWATVDAGDGPDGTVACVVVPVDRDGVGVLDDWDGMGQSRTGTGTTVLDGVAVADAEVLAVRSNRGGERNAADAPYLQLYMQALMAGILRSVVTDAGAVLRGRTRTFSHAPADVPAHDPLLQQTVGRIAATAYAAEAAVLAAADTVEAADAAERAGTPDPALIAAASLAAAKVKVHVDETALAAAASLFEVGGASAASRSRNLDRHWRNIRTLTLHNPTSYKAVAVGDHAVNGTPLPRNAYF